MSLWAKTPNIRLTESLRVLVNVMLFYEKLYKTVKSVFIVARAMGYNCSNVRHILSEHNECGVNL